MVKGLFTQVNQTNRKCVDWNNRRTSDRLQVLPLSDFPDTVHYDIRFARLATPSRWMSFKNPNFEVGRMRLKSLLMPGFDWPQPSCEFQSFTRFAKAELEFDIGV
jgi:hypothetical protein